MFEMGAETMNLPLEEKMKFEQGDDGRSSGYVYTSAAQTVLDVAKVTKLEELQRPMKKETRTTPSLLTLPKTMRSTFRIPYTALIHIRLSTAWNLLSRRSYASRWK